MFMSRLAKSLLVSTFFAALPASSNYQLNNYNYGSGGTGGSTSSNYSLNATTGQTGSTPSSSTNFTAKPGNNSMQQAHVPSAPTFTNPSNYYNRLHFILNPGSNPTDTKYSIAISSDNFVTTQFVQNDNTIGSSKGLEDYQTYAAWGSATGQLVTGLNPATTYAIKVNAIHGSFSETEYGPMATAATVPPSITFDIDVAATDTDTNPPFTTGFDSLLPATVVTANNRIWVDLDTNANAGARIYVSSANGGLASSSKSFSITSATGNLGALSSGYGLQGVSSSQVSGGPLTITSPYNGSAQNVGVLTNSLREVFGSSAPISGARGSFTLLAKVTNTTPASDDYQDVLTVVAAASF